MKANTDAAMGPDGMIGIGAVVRDEGGHIVAILMANFQEISNAFYGEVKAINECLVLIRTIELSNIILEMDLSEAVKKILARPTGESESVLIVRHIQGHL